MPRIRPSCIALFLLVVLSLGVWHLWNPWGFSRTKKESAIPPVRLIVVTPFPAAQLERVLQRFLPALTRYRACSGRRSIHVDMTFAIATSLDDLAPPQRKVLEEEIRDLARHPSIAGCLGSVTLSETRTPEPYASSRASGSSYQFYTFFKSELAHDYDYWFLMEPDVEPVDVHWLDRVYQEVASETLGSFWVKGSPPYHVARMLFNATAFSRGKNTWTRKPWGADPVGTRTDTRPAGDVLGQAWCPSPAMTHINGNGIYALHQPDFDAVLEGTLHQNGYPHFDAAIARFFCTNVDLWVHSRFYYRYSTFIVHVWKAEAPGPSAELEHFMKHVRPAAKPVLLHKTKNG